MPLPGGEIFSVLDLDLDLIKLNEYFSIQKVSFTKISKHLYNFLLQKMLTN